MTTKKPVLLVSFHNQKALGIRYLEKSLKAAGFPVYIIFFKGFNSVKPDAATQEELELLDDVIDHINPGLIGLSVMTSLYLDTVLAAGKIIKFHHNIPVVWGGVHATLFPERCLEHSDFVIRGEGEKAIVELAEALFNNKPFGGIQNLAYKKDGKTIINELRPLCQDLDLLGYPEMGGENKYFINNNRLSSADPQLGAVSYELTASRGCPFTCSYCCSVNIKRLYKGKGNYVRFRSVSSVLDELNYAKSLMKNLKVIHFWDEIFSDDKNWVDEFSARYKEEIGLPFEIWSHPLKVESYAMKKLVDAGLYKVVMGIQSGSPRVRKEIFHRAESQLDILNAGKILNECGVPQVIYDFMLRHPFEMVDDLRQTYELCMQLKPPFELQLHGLNFLPGTDIVDMAIKSRFFSREHLDEIMFSPMQKQYDMYWEGKGKGIMSDYWYSLIYMSQFNPGRRLARLLTGTKSQLTVRPAIIACKLMKPLSKLRYFSKKSALVFRALKKPGNLAPQEHPRLAP